MNSRRLLLSAGLLLASQMSMAQFGDSLKLEIGAQASFASKDYQPLWITSNKFGTIADRKSDASIHIKATNMHRFGHGADSLNKPWYVSYGVNAFNNQHFDKTFVEEAYLKAGYRQLQFRAGRFEETTGDLDAETSSGSLGISGNALPIPKIGFAVTDYTSVPFTGGFVKFKGQISHGWFGNNRYMKDAFYHEKLFYLQLGKKKFKLYGGVQHFVEWGGHRASFQLERSFKGFLDVLFVREADDGSVGTSTNGLPANRPGDQRGLLELGVKWENDKLLINAYNQTPFETGRDVDPRNIDRLIGIIFYSKKTNPVLKKVTAELLYTYDMLSFVEEADRQSYYNNGFYKTGWEYEDRVVGTPLFTNRIRASKYYPSSYTPYNWNAPDDAITGNNNIVNNRIVAFHVAGVYNLANWLEAKTMITYSLNYGTHTNASPFYPHKKQLYTLQQFKYNLKKAGMQLMAGVAFDSGDMSDNTGFLIGVNKVFDGFKLFR